MLTNLDYLNIENLANRMTMEDTEWMKDTEWMEQHRK